MIGILVTVVFLLIGCRNSGSDGTVPFMSFNVSEAYMPSDDDTVPSPSFSLILADTSVEDTVVDLSFYNPDLFLSLPASVTVNAGSKSSGLISMISEAVTGVTTVTASCGTNTAEASILVYDNSTAPEIVSFNPVSQTLTAGSSAVFTVEEPAGLLRWAFPGPCTTSNNSDFTWPVS